jgi:hypothetical protein
VVGRDWFVVPGASPLFGTFTIVLGAFAFWDATLTAFEPVPYALCMTASPKLPVSILWDFVLGFLLLRGKLAPHS